MAEHSTPEERTEMPTDRRMSRLREEGQVHMGQDLPVVASLAAGFFSLYFLIGWFLADMKQIMTTSFSMIANAEEITQEVLVTGAAGVLYTVGPEFAVILVVVSAISSLAVLLQTNFNVKKKKIHFQFTKLNPVNGVRQVFSPNGVVNTLKALMKLVLILPVGYFGLKHYAPDMLMLTHMGVHDVLSFTGVAAWDLFLQILYILIALAIFDFFWSKHQWLKQNKMTKDEVKDEKKSVEGDEVTKKKMQMKGLQRILQRIQESVPQADVVITNPTHYAIALKYDRDNMAAPHVVAKGKGFLALRIREIAKEAGVPIVERKPLARALYASCEVGVQIPYELFRAVAEVLAYVFRLKNPRAAVQRPQG